LGTRLRPLTSATPKALVPVLNRPLLGVLLAQLEEAGALRVAVNTHHLADQVHHFLAIASPPRLEVLVRPEPDILGTGGGLRSLAEALGNEPFLAINADILTDLDLGEIYRQHREQALATLVLHDYAGLNNVWLDKAGRVAGIGAPPPHTSGPALAYTGVQVVSHQMLEWLPKKGPADLVAVWQQALGRGEYLAAVVVKGHFWQDLGTPEAYLQAHLRLLTGTCLGLNRFFPPISDPFCGAGTVMEAGVNCGGGVCLGREVWVGRGTRLKNTVVWDRARLGPGLTLENCVVGQGATVQVSVRNAVLV